MKTFTKGQTVKVRRCGSSGMPPDDIQQGTYVGRSLGCKMHVVAFSGNPRIHLSFADEDVFSQDCQQSVPESPSVSRPAIDASVVAVWIEEMVEAVRYVRSNPDHVTETVNTIRFRFQCAMENGS